MWVMRVGLDLFQNVEIAVEFLAFAGNLLAKRGEGAGVRGDFVVHADFGLVNEVPVVEAFHPCLKSESYQESDRDGEEVKEEVAEAVKPAMRKMNIKHATLQGAIPHITM